MSTFLGPPTNRFLTEIVQMRLAEDLKNEHAAGEIPMRPCRAGYADEVAKAVLFLASDNSSLQDRRSTAVRWRSRELAAAGVQR